MAKGTPIHVHLLGDPDVRRFAEGAEKVCDLFERVDDLPKVYFLQQMEELLPLVYSLAHRLPDPFNWAEDDDDIQGWEPGPEAFTSNERMALLKEWHERIGKKLEPHRRTDFVFDPVDPSDRKIVQADLARLLADAYVDLKAGLTLFAKSGEEEKAEAIWDWRHGFVHEWGPHALQALLPIHMLLHHHYDEDDEVFDI